MVVMNIISLVLTCAAIYYKSQNGSAMIVKYCDLFGKLFVVTGYVAVVDESVTIIKKEFLAVLAPEKKKE